MIISYEIPETHKDSFQELNINPLKIGNPQTGTMANSEDPDESSHKVAFHHGLHCFLRQNRTSAKQNVICFNL